MITSSFDKALDDVRAERESQQLYNDAENTEGTWLAYMANYMSRWALPFTFDTKKYNFRTCMVKVAALAVAAIEWCDYYELQDSDTVQAQRVADSVGDRRQNGRTA